MKSTFIIEVETKDMTKVFCEEDGIYGNKKQGDDITKEIERDLHGFIKEAIENDLKEPDNSKIIFLLDEFVTDGSDVCVEGFEQLSDYGKITFKVKEEIK